MRIIQTVRRIVLQSQLKRKQKAETAEAKRRSRMKLRLHNRVETDQIGMIRPTGWHQEKYPGIVESEPPYLYHRCHLIAYALTGQNANEKNLITGTKYMNTKGMLPWEIKVARYLDNSDHHVLYRVTPYFKGEELLCRGVEMEAYSVEDSGRDLCFHVFVYDIQPGIVIDYQTGENRAA